MNPDLPATTSGAVRVETLPSGLAVEHYADGARLTLPPRRAGCVLPGIILAFGAFLTLFMIAWMATPLSGAARDTGPARWLSLVFALLGLPGLLAGLGLLAAGFFLWRGRSRTEIRLDREAFAAVEHFGPFRWTRRVPLDRVASFAVMAPATPVTGAPAAAAAAAAFMGLRVDLRDRRPRVVAAFNPPEVARDLEKALREELARIAPGTSLARPFDQAAMSHDPMPPYSGPQPVRPDHAPRPDGTDIRCEESGELGALLIDVPPRGLRRGTHGLFFFSLIWNGFMLVFVLVVVFGGDRGDGSPLMLAPFLAVGVGLLLLSVHLAKSRTMLVVLPDRLAVRRRSPLRKSERIILRREMADIRRGPSGTTVNDRPLMQIQIVPAKGRPLGFLTGRTNEELDWLTAELRRKLGLSAREADEGPTD